MQLDFWAATDVGKKRSHNEDNFLVDKKLHIFVVADGMGGHAAGEVASSLCVRQVRDAIAKNQDLIQQCRDQDTPANRSQILRLLEHSVQDACSTIFHQAQEDDKKRGMGTTCTLLLVVGHRGFMAHVGDSRMYLMRQGKIHQMSDDHSLINELVKRGKLKLEEIDKSPYRDYKNAVTRAVGVYESVEVDTLDFDVLPGDQFHLCSDGLHAYLNEKNMTQILSRPDTKQATEMFIDLALRGGGHDNITAVVVRVAGAEKEDIRSKELSLKINVLKGMPIFRYLSYRELVRLMNITQVRNFKHGEVIIEEGTEGDELFILLEGKARLHKGEAYITTLEQGAHFGEMALVDSAPRSVSVTAEDGVRSMIIRRPEFYEIIRNESKLSVKLLWSFVQVLTERLRKTTEQLSDSEHNGESVLPADGQPVVTPAAIPPPAPDPED